MLGSLLTRLFSHLLKLYPDRFLDEFGREMRDVFVQALSGFDDIGTPPVIRKLKMARLFFREVWYEKYLEFLQLYPGYIHMFLH